MTVGSTVGLVPGNKLLVPPYYGDLDSWFIAGRGITLGADPDITAWADQKGSNHATQSGAANLCPHAGTDAYGAYVEFDGSDDVFAANGLAALFTGTDTPVTVALAASDLDVAGTANRRLYIAYHSTGAGYQYVNLPASGGNCYAKRRNDASSAQTLQQAGILSTNDRVVDTFDGTDRTVYTVTGSMTQNQSLGAVTLDQFEFGNNGVSLVGKIREILLYNRGLSATESAIVQAYLARWGF
jgi:hypothetical protein